MVRPACPEPVEGRASVFSSGEDNNLSTVASAKGEAGDVGSIVDAARQKNKAIEAG